ncbi:MAG: anaerobic ribonucleoside-triphosphate reductase activating protein [Clostridiales bacterium]|nr:MAG: anaerobic ribonucleoside-triphosphate reductase activating protein [Clostridiales bacterium]
MIIRGLQKLTLLDYPGKVACTVFTDGCNFACPFCHNASLAHRPGVPPVGAPPAIPADEVLAFLRKRTGVLDGVCITGGEPLLQEGLKAFLSSVKELGYSVKLDTNGSLPARLKELVAGGLVDTVAMDVKNAPDRYAETIGRPVYDMAPVCESVDFLRSLSGRYEFRTTVVRELHTISDIEAIGRWLAGAEKYFLQSFTDSGDILAPGLHAHEPETLRRMLSAVRPYIPAAALRGVE